MVNKRKTGKEEPLKDANGRLLEGGDVRER